MKIKNITARQILDSRGNPTIETEITSFNGTKAVASVPSGASTGVHEAFELRDRDKDKYRGMGVLNAVKIINTKINKALKNFEVGNQEKLDQALIDLDGTTNKKELGANSILSVSLAVARLAALTKKQELFNYIQATHKFDSDLSTPTPFFNIFNGGKHADTNLDLQEFMITPIKKNLSFEKQLQISTEVFHALGKVLKKNNLDTDTGNEGGYAPNISSTVDAIEYIITAIMQAGFNPGKEIALGLDAGTSEIYNKKTRKYIFSLDNQFFTSTDLIGLYKDWLSRYPIILIEDGLDQDDWENWQAWTKEQGKNLAIVGDDLFTTNINRLMIGIEKKAANTVLIKPNQIGTLTETINCIKLAQANNYKTMISHRSGETCDDFIADLAVGTNANYIKAGAPNRGERIAKYNRLLKIEELI